MTQKYFFQMQSHGRLPIPKIMAVIMLGVFGIIPIMLILTTLHEVGEAPWVVLIWIVSFFPLGVVFFLKKILSRYAVGMSTDGFVEVLYPLKTVRIPTTQIASAGTVSTYLPQSHMRVANLVLASATGKAPAVIAIASFAPEDVNAFLVALQQANPSLKITG